MQTSNGIKYGVSGIPSGRKGCYTDTQKVLESYSDVESEVEKSNIGLQQTAWKPRIR